ncbi:MAG: amidohydrolase [Paracoccaceae bacterium]
MTLAASDLEDIVVLRRALHGAPELSGAEADTAAHLRGLLAGCAPDRILSGLGGHGLAAIWEGRAPGPTVMLRAELDALPIVERTGLPHASRRPGVAHLCGHDGHMAILAGVARLLSRRRPAHGRAVLLFQPAEETGAGAAAVLADPRFAEIAPDWAFALHNLPGLARGRAALAPGPVCCASRGMRLRLTGRSAHASQPETGCSPAPALAALMAALPALAPPGPPPGPGFRLVTLTHATLGVPAFGIAPAQAELWATLRTMTDAGMAALVEQATRLAQDSAARHGLALEASWHDLFAHCENDPEAVEIIGAAARRAGLKLGRAPLPMRFSEDFGQFGAGARAALLMLGAGEEHPALHDEHYDFPDALIAPGVRLFAGVLEALLGAA